jgi:hypothetical protein
VSATQKGVTILERGSQVHFMADSDIPISAGAEARRPGGRIRPRRANRSFAARRSSTARASAARATLAPYYTDNSMHNLRVERFYEER